MAAPVYTNREVLFDRPDAVIQGSTSVQYTNREVLFDLLDSGIYGTTSVH